ncbi:MAG: methionyl-tRNA formyltransferase [Campylobacter sp.]|nr:methionyl-tRNA formyltransferase [Campylobacter sp.]
MKKIVFMGTPDYALSVLKALCEHFEIVGVFTQPDKPVGRKAVLSSPPVKEFALSKGFAIFQPQNLKNGAAEQIALLKPDFIVVAAYGQILGEDILSIAPCINLHASILPEFRGASPIQQMVLNGKKLGGITAMKMGVGLDDGDMLGFEVCDIEGKSSSELFSIFATMAGKLALKTLENYEKINPITQFSALSSKCKKIKKEEGKISFNDEISIIWRKFLAFNPWPSIYLSNGTKLLKIKIHSQNVADEQIGKICAINQNSFCVGAKKGLVEIFSIQEAGKKALEAKEYLNGKRLGLGDNIFS